jgi:hypothetical protein
VSLTLTSHSAANVTLVESPPTEAPAPDLTIHLDNEPGALAAMGEALGAAVSAAWAQRAAS